MTGEKTEDGTLDIMVAPMLLSKDCILSDINDVFKGILVKGDCTGDVMLYGKGAGKLPTASAVVADVVDCAKHLKARKRIFWTDSDGSQVASYKDSKTAMYIRVAGKGEMAQSLFPDSEIMKADGNTVLMTQEYKFGEIEEKIAKLNENGEKVLSAIRIGNL